MTSYVFLAASLLAGGASSDSKSESLKSWEDKYGRTLPFSSYEIFASNEQTVKFLNDDAKKRGHDTKYALNQFADLSPSDFRAKILMPSFDSQHKCKWPEERYSKIKKTDALPSFDWRNASIPVVSSVKNQENCGSCWAFSVGGNVEGQIALKNKKAVVSVSVEEITDCSNACEQDGQEKLCNNQCNGGLPWLAYEDIMKWGKITTDAAYPYDMFTNTCRTDSSMPVAGSISNWTAATPDMGIAEALLVQQGPLSITLNADKLQFYFRGILRNNDIPCLSSGSDHAVLLVGFGDDTANASNPVHYWTVKNSWGSSWGEKGFFRIEADKDLCGIWDCVTSGIV